MDLACFAGLGTWQKKQRRIPNLKWWWGGWYRNFSCNIYGNLQRYFPCEIDGKELSSNKQRWNIHIVLNIVCYE